MNKFDPIAEKRLQIRTAHDWNAHNQEAQALSRFQAYIVLLSLFVIVLSLPVIQMVFMPLVNQCVADYTGYFEVSQCVITGNPALNFVQDLIRTIVYAAGS